jgi:hypothetical protein
MECSIENSLGDPMVFYCINHYSYHHKFQEKKCKRRLDNNVFDNDKILHHNYGFRGGEVHIKSNSKPLLLLLKWIWNNYDIIA